MTPEHLVDILPRLREVDARELMDGSRHETLLSWAHSRVNAAGAAFTVLQDERPMWCGGVLEGAVSGIGAMWLVGAKGCEPLVMYAYRVWQVIVAEGGYRRLECKCFADNEPANRFAKIMGLAFEGTLRGFGLSGADMNQYGMVGGSNGR